MFYRLIYSVIWGYLHYDKQTLHYKENNCFINLYLTNEKQSTFLAFCLENDPYWQIVFNRFYDNQLCTNSNMLHYRGGMCEGIWRTHIRVNCPVRMGAAASVSGAAVIPIWAGIFHRGLKLTRFRASAAWSMIYLQAGSNESFDTRWMRTGAASELLTVP